MKRFKSILFCLTAAFLLCAAAKKSLIRDEQKLIDLDKAIEFAVPGADSSDKTEGDESSDSKDETQTGGTIISEKNDDIIVISVRGDIITYNGTPCTVERLEKLLRQAHNDNMKFSLVDDFAEAHAYKKVLKTLERLHSEIGLEFSYEN